MRSIVAATVLALCATLAIAQFGGGGPFGGGSSYGGGNYGSGGYGSNDGGGGGGQRESHLSVMHFTLISTTCVELAVIDLWVAFSGICKSLHLTCSLCMLHFIKSGPMSGNAILLQ